jgi:hypothetical protein
LFDVFDLLHVDDARRRPQHGEIIGHQRDLSAIDTRKAGHLAVGGSAFPHARPMRHGEQTRFRETARIDQIVDAFARIEIAVRLALCELIRPAHSERLDTALFQLLECFFECHG